MKRQQLILFVFGILLATSLACGFGGSSDEPAEVEQPAQSEATLTQPTVMPAMAVPGHEHELEVIPAKAELPAETGQLEVQGVIVNTVEFRPKVKQPEAPAPTATPLPQELMVAGVYDYINVNNQFEVVGTIYNGTGSPVSGVELALTATDAAGNSLVKDFFGNPVDTALFAPMISTIQPGQSAPFEFTIYGEVQPDVYEVTISNYAQAEAAQPVNVAVENGRMATLDNGILYVVGELVNQGDSPVQISKLISAVMDADGRVISVGDSLEDGFYLAPAGDPNGYDRIAFRNAVNFGGLETTAESWTTFMDAAIVEPKTPYALSLAEPTIYQDKNGKTRLIGTVTNNSQENLEVHLIGTVYAAGGLVLDVDTLGLPLYVLGPGESLPYEFAWLDIINQTTGEVDKIDHVKVQVDQVATTPSIYGVVPLQTSNDMHEVSEGWWDMEGEIVNNSDQNFYRNTVVLGLFDAHGKLVGTNFGYTYADGKDNIEPQDVTAYSISVYTAPEIDPATVTVKTYVQGNLR